MAMTSCEVFADIGFPMDSRVRLDFGFTDREPARASYRLHPDGFLEGKLTTDAYWQSEIPDAPEPYFHPKPSEKPRGSSTVARLNFKKADRAVTLSFNRPPAGSTTERAKAHIFVAQPQAQAQAPVSVDPMDRTRRQLLIQFGKNNVKMSLNQWCDVFRLFGSYAEFKRSF